MATKKKQTQGQTSRTAREQAFYHTMMANGLSASQLQQMMSPQALGVFPASITTSPSTAAVPDSPQPARSSYQAKVGDKIVPTPDGIKRNICHHFNDHYKRVGQDMDRIYSLVDRVDTDSQLLCELMVDGENLERCGCFWNRHNECFTPWVPVPVVADRSLFDSVVLPDLVKEEILAAVSQVEHHDMIFKQWGFDQVFEKGTAVSLLFYGQPGTGKTLMGQAIANLVGQKLKVLQTAELQSSEPGQMERNIKAQFEGAEKSKTILLFDECDSVIYDRNSVGMILAAEINALLSALEKHQGIVIFTTNRLQKMDEAFERRLSAKIEFPFPDEAARVNIWRRMVPGQAPLAADVDFTQLARVPLAGGNIKNAVLNAARMAAYQKSQKITGDHLLAAVQRELKAKKTFHQALNGTRRAAALNPDLSLDKAETTLIAKQ